MNFIPTTINSVSGGETSSYLAVHYPADYDIFAVVCIDCHNANGGFWKNDKKLLQIVRDKLSKYSSQYPEFVATAEDPQTLLTMLQLEQKIGREITWIRGIGFDQLIYAKKAIPNIKMRWCTEIMKIIPIFQFCYNYTNLPVDMRIGFRYDEIERAQDLRSTIDFPINCNNYGQGNQNWVKDFEYRNLIFPMIEDKIIHPTIKDYWKRNQDVTFPEDTGCQMCYWKHPQQIKSNSLRESSRPVVLWSNVIETIMGNTFKKDASINAILEMGVQLDFFTGTGPGCQAGICGI